MFWAERSHTVEIIDLSAVICHFKFPSSSKEVVNEENSWKAATESKQHAVITVLNSKYIEKNTFQY